MDRARTWKGSVRKAKLPFLGSDLAAKRQQSSAAVKAHCARNPDSLAKHALKAALVGSWDNMKAAKPQRT